MRGKINKAFVERHFEWLFILARLFPSIRRPRPTSLIIIIFAAFSISHFSHVIVPRKVSHTTDDMLFQWDPSVPLVVDDNIELPQLALVKNLTADCKPHSPLATTARTIYALQIDSQIMFRFFFVFWILPSDRPNLPPQLGTQVYSTGNFTCLEVVFTLKRRLGYYLFHTYIPTCLIVIMSVSCVECVDELLPNLPILARKCVNCLQFARYSKWVSFWIKPEAAPARVTLGVTSLLTLSTQHAKSQASLPPVSYLKAVDAFMSVCTIFVFMALMEYCLVNIVLGDTTFPKPPKPKPPPQPTPVPPVANPPANHDFAFAASKFRASSKVCVRAPPDFGPVAANRSTIPSHLTFPI